MHLLGFHEIFTTRSSLTRVRAVPRYSFKIETLEALNEIRPTIGIMPSGLPWIDRSTFGSSASQVNMKDCNINSGSCFKMHEYIFVVPYSAHSCYSEIQEFIELLRPVKIKGIVSSTSCFIDPHYYFDHLCGSEQAQWRVQQKLENEEGKNTVEVADKPIPVGISPVAGRKRKIGGIDLFGIHISRVSSLRRRISGVKITDTESLPK